MLSYVKRIFLYFFIPLLIDRVTKYSVVSQTVPDQQVFPFLDIYLTYNRGVSWGVGSSECHSQFLFVSVLVALVMGMFCWFMYKTPMKRVAVDACFMILSGAISNFYDRICFGGVVDFILFYWGSWWFPVFNMADVFIFLGTCVLLYLHAKDDLCT